MRPGETAGSRAPVRRPPSRCKRLPASASQVCSRAGHACILPGLGLACGMAPGTYYPGLSAIAAEPPSVVPGLGDLRWSADPGCRG
jgi:hypothetical protein